MYRRFWSFASRNLVILFFAMAIPFEQANRGMGQTVQKPLEMNSFSAELVSLMSNGKPRPAIASSGKDEKAVAILPSKVFWSSPGNYRIDDSNIFHQSTLVVLAYGKGISIDHGQKIYCELSQKQVMENQSDFFAIALKHFAQFDGSNRKADAQEEIDGIKCFRFDVKTKEDRKSKWDYRIWVHSESKRPVRMDWKPDDETGDFSRLNKVEWNVKTENLFEITPPKGYRAKIWNVYDWAADQIAHSLTAYVQLFDEYPKVDRIDNQLIAAFEKKIKECKFVPSEHIPGFMLLQLILTDPTTKYRGKIVQPKDKDKLLLSWTQPDGKIRAIFVGSTKSVILSDGELKELDK
ncbi:hypothetical protein KIH39_25105 [Telmatocola sphagniphila]|uniref:Uncharacterized protein n=1 Tax=Telmatocola sphagniphila TaxID=1123043 RepID=A0A8E6B6I6_9BACT|nr:hypothetical protein [Telmatocola sphagniphila]QVL32076.1 hypothetical protein KIH39_25105 [Telmatocola sphagniphila]